MDLEVSVRKFLRQEGIGTGDTVLCAVSGGADSVCMLHILHTLRQEEGFALCCVHVHHGIRGEEADRDAAFVRDLCESLQVPFVVKEVNVPARVKDASHTGTEEAARHLRYEALKEEAERIGAASAGALRQVRQPQVRIAVAHNLDDNVETVLFQLFRGTGLHGLSGIRPVNGPVIRPLLDVSRKEIEAYLTERGIGWRTDHTNQDKSYARNRIRHSLLPEAEQTVNSCAKEHIAHTAGDVRDMLRYLDTRIAEAEERCRVVRTADVCEGRREAQVFSVKALQKEDPFLRGEIIRKALARLQEKAGKGGYYQVGRVHVEDVVKLCAGRNGRAHLDLPGDVCAERLHDNLILFLLA